VAVSDGTLKIIQATSPLEDIWTSPGFVDHYFYVLRCAKCEREFQLNMDTYHGNGDWA